MMRINTFGTNFCEDLCTGLYYGMEVFSAVVSFANIVKGAKKVLTSKNQLNQGALNKTKNITKEVLEIKYYKKTEAGGVDKRYKDYIKFTKKYIARGKTPEQVEKLYKGVKTLGNVELGLKSVKNIFEEGSSGVLKSIKPIGNIEKGITNAYDLGQYVIQ